MFSIGMQQSRNPNEEGSSNFLSKHTYTYNKFLQVRSSSKFFCIICRNQLRSNSFLWRLEFPAAGHYLNIFQFISPKYEKIAWYFSVACRITQLYSFWTFPGPPTLTKTLEHLKLHNLSLAQLANVRIRKGTEGGLKSQPEWFLYLFVESSVL